VAGYAAMLTGASGSIAFFFFEAPVSYAGLGSFALAAAGMVAESLIGGGTRKRSAD